MKSITRFTKYIFLFTALTAVHFNSFAQISVDGVPSDDDGILSIIENPFDPSKFIIGSDQHIDKFKDQDKLLRGMADCYFNISDGADAEKQNFKLCKKLGLGVALSAKEKKHVGGEQWMKMSDQQIDQYVRKQVESGKKDKSIIFYHLCDEPSALAFPKLAVAVAAVHKYAPGKFANINLYPNYATLMTLNNTMQRGTATYKEYLDQFVNIVKPDFICYDNYMIQFGMDQEVKASTAQYYTNIMDVREASLRSNIPWHNYVSGNQIRFWTTIPSMPNLLLQAYTSLAAGAGGIRWYTYKNENYDYALTNNNYQKTLTWYYLREVNRQLSILGPMIKTLKSTGVYFTDPNIDPSLPLLPGKVVSSVECKQPLMIGEFESKKGNKYVMVVNLSLEKSARFILNTKIPNERIFAIPPVDQPYFSEITKNMSDMKTNTPERIKLKEQKAYWLTAGQGVLIKCSGIGE